MIRITESGIEGTPLPPFGYVQGKRPWAWPVLSLTRWMRARNVERYMVPGRRHLDIGCGDCFFLSRSQAEERIGLDPLLGDEIGDRLDFPDDHFEHVTMLAVIEHIAEPRPLIAEIARILRPGGRLIMTTPKQAADAIIHLYVDDVDEQHETYFDVESMRALCAPHFTLTAAHNFAFGLNQSFCLDVVKPVA